MRPTQITFLILLLSHLPATAAEIRIDGKTSSRGESLDLLSTVAAMFEERISEVPAQGTKPVLVRKDTAPRADLRGLPKEYWINLTSIDSRAYAQIAYQAGHEFTHVWIDPEHSNAFVEAVCIAMSYQSLERMAADWGTSRDEAKRKYSSEFTDYREKAIREALAKFKLNSQEDARAWVATDLGPIASRLRGSLDRDAQSVCAVVIDGVLTKHPKAWGALVRLGQAVPKGEHGTTDFKRWRSLVREDQRPLVDDLAGLFETPLATAPPAVAKQ